jgi:hypothetical protein
MYTYIYMNIYTWIYIYICIYKYIYICIYFQGFEVYAKSLSPVVKKAVPPAPVTPEDVGLIPSTIEGNFDRIYSDI